MIRFVGSNYQYRGEQLTRPELIYVLDHHYDERNRCFPVRQLLDASACDPLSHTVIFDHILQEDDEMSKYNCVYLPLFMATSTKQFNQANIQPEWNKKTCTFNFMINKRRHNRTFLLMLIEHFGLTDYEYTLCWKHANFGRRDMVISANNPAYQHIIESAKLDLPNRQYLFGSENLLDQGLQYGHLTNAQVYKTFLQEQVFEPAGISLITEPGFYEHETIITEKTIMGIWAGTLPIWVGGWRQADYLRSLGFDVFDDIIDHSYQNLPDVWDRCYQAVAKNIDLLKDRDRVLTFISNNHQRLQANLDLLKNNCFTKICHQMISKLPINLQNEFVSQLPDPAVVGR
jgi:hypothetical protein